MTVKTGTAWAGTFVTQDATGALATPSAGPAGVLYVDGTANAATVTITGSNPYKFAVTLPSLTAGQRVDMYITATIDGIATAEIVASEQADTALVSEVKTETAAISLGVPANGEMDIYIADSLHVSISDLGSLADLDKLYVSFKERYDDEDSESILQLEYGQGLLVVNGETATATDGSITIDDAVDGDITIDIVASVMDDITAKVCVYDVKIIRSAGVEVQTLHQGKARFHRAITRAIS